ncbi:TIR domain-containing protein [Ruegeria sp. 2205SS24-7]|uniref:nSTAND1 domain-containing NTPase n=1 Tax=Ruegeria discodermiae TaxID=3064389 RepID=UPI0027420F3A|nr:TIR domain-containing protein [Ruegeria sp. 2205SS24-7]MDP5219865.1 TIR domain-containing protein [Ruegeria sp. 2205SS24-7]
MFLRPFVLPRRWTESSGAIAHLTLGNVHFSPIDSIDGKSFLDFSRSMARVFISHSSRDNALAGAMKIWLHSEGFETPFLDFDKHSGIPPGANWEKVLYREIENSEALIILQTQNWVESKWCFAEYTQARALGKPIFPVVEDQPGHAPIGHDIQTLDLSADRESGLQRLSKELTQIALNAQGGFRWDNSRPPYPGLSAFQEEDAALYFGRDDDIRRLMERLNARRIQGGPKVLALLGASGSGKSSLLRAGVLPRIKRDPRNWLVLPTMRPQTRPVDELARTLALAMLQGTQWREWREALRCGDISATLRDLAIDLRIQRGHSEAQILLPVDQAEELFGISVPAEADRFFDILNELGAEESPFLVVLAQRSDFLEKLQSAQRLKARYEEFSLGPLPLSRIPQIIEGPARIAGLRVEDSLVMQATKDAETEDALPLLAFALRELYDRFGADGCLSHEDYDALGDVQAGLTPLENSVRQAADDVLDQTQPGPEDLAALRSAFVPAMVWVNDKGEYVRRPAFWDELPGMAHILLERLTKARLLVIRQEDDRRVIEVAHEALLRKWTRLRNWLDDAREFLLGRQQLQADIKDWERARTADKPAALLTGLKLNRARGWMADRPHQLSATERSYILASIEAAEAETRRRDRQRRRIVWGSVAASFVLLIVAGVAVFGLVQANIARDNAELAQQEADKQANLALSRKLASDARLALSDDKFELAMLLSAEGYQRAATREAESVLFDMIERYPFLRGPLPGHDETIYALSFTPTGEHLLSGDFGGHVKVWSTDSFALESDIDLQGGLTGFGYDRSGKLLVTTGHSQDLEIFSDGLPEGKSQNIPNGCDVSWAVGAFVAEEELFSACRYYGIIRWDFQRKDWVEVTSDPDRPELVGSAAFHPDRPVAILEYLGQLSIWDLRTGEREETPFDEKLVKDLLGDRPGVSFIPGTAFFATGGGGQLALWEVDRAKPLTQKEIPIGQTRSIAVHANGRTLATGAQDGELYLWDLSIPRRLGGLAGTDDGRRVRAMALSPDGKKLAIGGTDGLVIFWNIAETNAPEQVLSGQPGALARLLDAYIDADGAPVKTTSYGNVVLWENAVDARSTIKFGGAFVNPDRFVTGNHEYVARQGVGGRNNWIEFLNVKAKDQLRINNPTGNVQAIPIASAIDNEGKWLAGAYDDGDIILVDLNGARRRAAGLGMELSELLKEPSEVRDTFIERLSPDVPLNGEEYLLSLGAAGNRVAISDGQQILIWTRVTDNWQSALYRSANFFPEGAQETSTPTIGSMALSSDGTILAMETPFGMTILKLESNTKIYLPINMIRAEKSQARESIMHIHSFAISPDAGSIAIRIADGYVVWSLAANTVSETFAFPTNRRTRARFSHDGTRLLVASDDSMAMWTIATRTLLHDNVQQISGDVRRLAFDETGMYLAAAGDGNSVATWHLGDKAQRARKTTLPAAVSKLEFRSNLNTLRIFDVDGRIFDWNLSGDDVVEIPELSQSGAGSGTQTNRQDENAEPPSASNGSLTVNADRGGLAIWPDDASRAIKHPLIGARNIFDVRFVSETTVAALGTDDRGAAYWEIPAVPVIERACRMVNRNLTMEEWETYLPSDVDYRKTCRPK